MLDSTDARTASAFRAADAPATRRVVRRRRVVCTAVIGLGVFLVVLALVIRTSDADQQRRDSSGRDTNAVVTQIVPHSGGTGPTSSSATVTFHTADGVEHSAELTRARAATPYRPGAVVTVLYDARGPTHVSILGEPFASGLIPWFVPCLAGTLLLVLGGGAARWLRWAERVLDENPWVTVASTVIEKPMSDSGRRVILRMLELNGAPDSSTLAAPIGWRERALDELSPVAWVAGSDRRFLVASPGGAPLRRFRRVRLIGGEALQNDDPLLRTRHTTSD